MQVFEKHFSIVDNFKVILLPVEASVPRAQQAEEKHPDYTEIPPEPKPASNIGRISREELYHDLHDHDHDHDHHHGHDHDTALLAKNLV